MFICGWKNLWFLPNCWFRLGEMAILNTRPWCSFVDENKMFFDKLLISSKRNGHSEHIALTFLCGCKNKWFLPNCWFRRGEMAILNILPWCSFVCVKTIDFCQSVHFVEAKMATAHPSLMFICECTNPWFLPNCWFRRCEMAILNILPGCSCVDGKIHVIYQILPNCWFRCSFMDRKTQWFLTNSWFRRGEMAILHILPLIFICRCKNQCYLTSCWFRRNEMATFLDVHLLL